MKVLKEGLRRREGGRGGVGPHPSQLSSPALPAGTSVCRSAGAEGTAPRLFLYTLYYEV